MQGRPSRPRSRFLLLEHLEDRFLLSAAGPVAPAPLAPPPTAGPPTPALVTAATTAALGGQAYDSLSGQQTAPDSISAGALVEPARPDVDGHRLLFATPGPLAPVSSNSPLADNSSFPALASAADGYRPADGWHAPWAADQATPSLFDGGDPFRAARPVVEADRFSLASAAPLGSVPGVNLFADRAPLPSLGQVLGVRWVSRELFVVWDDGRPVVTFFLTGDLAGTQPPTPGSVPPINPRSDLPGTYEATAAVAPVFDAGVPRGPVSRPVSADPPVHLPVHAALTGTEIAPEKVSADASRQAVAAPGDTGRPAVSPAHLPAAPGAALGDPGAGLPAPGARALSTDSAGDAGLPPAGTARVTVRGKVALPAGGGGAEGAAAPAEESSEALVPQRGNALDLAGLPARAASLLEGGLPFDVPALTHGVDAFFARLGALGQGRDGVAGYARFVPWVVVLSAAVFEFARRWQAQPSALPALEQDSLPGGAGFLPEEDQ